MLLPDFMIQDYIKRGIIEVYPSPDFDTQLQPASLDLTLATTVDIPPNAPNNFTLLSTRESIALPDFIQGQLHGRSSMARDGLMIHISAGFVDPGFRGQLTLETVNFSNVTIHLEAGRRIAQIAFLLMAAPAVAPYNGVYQGQIGPTPSRRRNEL